MGDGSFPADFPADCPPADAEDAIGQVHRIVTSHELRAEDYLTYAESGRLPKADPCRRHGLSVYRSFEEARHHQELRPYLGGFIASGELTPDAGKTKLTNRRTGHTTWWPYPGIDRTAWFEAPVPCH